AGVVDAGGAAARASAGRARGPERAGRAGNRPRRHHQGDVRLRRRGDQGRRPAELPGAADAAGEGSGERLAHARPAGGGQHVPAAERQGRARRPARRQARGARWPLHLRGARSGERPDLFVDLGDPDCTAVAAGADRAEVPQARLRFLRHAKRPAVEQRIPPRLRYLLLGERAGAAVTALRPPETLTTQRLTLRAITLADAPDIFAYASDVETTRLMTFPRHRERAEAEAYARRCVNSWQDGSAFPWAITNRTTGGFMGAIELRLRPPKADFGYILLRAFWRQGFMSEAAGAVVAWAIAQPAIHRVW